jgi:flagellar biosynthesis protein FlhG
MNTIIPVASGKGGVGKSLFTANLGVRLAGSGKTVILVDLDLGGSNLHTCLGIKNRLPGIGSYVYKKEASLESLIVPTEVPQLHLLPGDGLLPGTANLSWFIKEKIIKELHTLVADYVLVDLGAGTSYNVLDFFLSSWNGIILMVPETTSILNAYGFIKSAVFRLLYRSFKPRSAEREMIQDFLSVRLEGSGSKLSDLVGKINAVSPDNGSKTAEILNNFFPRVVINMARTRDELSIGIKLREISRNNLGIEMEYIGGLPRSDDVPASLNARKPLALLDPGHAFVKSIDTVAAKLISEPSVRSPRLFEADEDIGGITFGY